LIGRTCDVLIEGGEVGELEIVVAGPQSTTAHRPQRAAA
jgi:hypothetical protein